MRKWEWWTKQTGTFLSPFGTFSNCSTLVYPDCRAYHAWKKDRENREMCSSGGSWLNEVNDVAYGLEVWRFEKMQLYTVLDVEHGKSSRNCKRVHDGPKREMTRLNSKKLHTRAGVEVWGNLIVPTFGVQNVCTCSSSCFSTCRVGLWLQA